MSRIQIKSIFEQIAEEHLL